MIITQDGYEPGDSPAGVPLIGYDNQITAITASSEAIGYPVANLLNSATHLVWRASGISRQVLGIGTSGADINYLAIARHNFFDANIGLSFGTTASAEAANGYLRLLVHFEGTSGQFDTYDSSGFDHALGQANSTVGDLTTAQFKFGAMSSAFDATGYIYTDADILNFGTEPFQIDFWLRINATGVQYYLFDTGDTGSGLSLRKTTGNVLVFKTGNTDRITGTTALTTGQWYHIALTRSTGHNTRLFLNGTQEGSTYGDSNSYAHISPASGHTRFGASLSDTGQLNGWMDELRVLIGVPTWTSNFTPPTAAYADGVTLISGNYVSLLHFDGADASTTISDAGNSDHVWTARGNAQIDTAQSKFGGASLLLDGTGDYVQGDGSDDLAFGPNNFTIDFWIRPAAIGALTTLYDARPIGVEGPYLRIHFLATNQIEVYVNGTSVITSTSTVSVGTWMHIAVMRNGGSTYLYINGVKEGSTFADTTIYANPANRPLIGIRGFDETTQAFNGHIDELRIVRGSAIFQTQGSGRFVPPTRAAGNQAIFGKNLFLDDALPLIFRFTPTTNYLVLNLTLGTVAAEIAVIYAGTLLVLERSVKVDVQHMDIVHARQSEVLAGMSESGNFLGRVLVREWRESQAEFAWFTPSWYRTNFEPFAEFAMTEPFFWAWNPDEYPEDTAFAWIIEEIRPETDPATRRMAATISMRAIA